MPEVRVLVHFEREEDPGLGGVPAEFAEPGDGLAPGFLVPHRVFVSFDGPEPELLALLGRERLVQPEGDHFAAEFRGGVDRAVAVGQVRFPVPLLDHAAADGGDDGDADANGGSGLLEFREAGRAQVAGADPAVGEVSVGKAGVLDLGEDLGPVGGLGVVDVVALCVGSRELQERCGDGPIFGCIRHGFTPSWNPVSYRIYYP